MSNIIESQELTHLRVKFKELTSIVIKINKEKNLDELLGKLVFFARKFTNADAGTLYTVEQMQLKFCVVQNETLGVDLSSGEDENSSWQRIDLLEQNQNLIAVRSVLTRKLINIEDVYNQDEFNVEGTKSFDAKNSYHSRSMLSVPVVEADDQNVIGVLQLINKKDSDGSVIAFSEDDCDLVLSLASLSASALTRLKGELQQLRAINKKLEYLANTDQLTKIANRLRFNTVFQQEYEKSKLELSPLSFVIFDIDHFKKINDTFGHKAGDYVLSTLADLVSKRVEQDMLFARWGGEEFVLLMPKYGLEEAFVKAEEIRQIIEMFDFAEVNQVTCSLGVASLDEGESIQELIHRADEALYLAKQSGRNQVQKSTR